MLAPPPVGCSSDQQRRACGPRLSLSQLELSRRPAPPIPQQLLDARGKPTYATWYPPAKRTDESPAWATDRQPVVALGSIPPARRKVVSRVRLYAYTADVSRLEFFAEFAGRAADALGIPTKTKRCETDVQAVTLIKGPFVHAKSREAIWRRTHARELVTFNAAPSVVEAWHAYLERTVMPGLGIRFETIGYHEPGFGRDMGRRPKRKEAPSASKAVDADKEAAAAIASA